MDIKNVTPEQAHELAMLAATQVGPIGAENIARAYCIAYMAIQEEKERGSGVQSIISRSDPLHPDYRKSFEEKKRLAPQDAGFPYG